MDFLDFKSPEQLLDFMSKNIEYGFVTKDNKIEKKDYSRINEIYKLQSPQEVLDNKVGLCYDQVEFERYIFEEIFKIPVRSFYFNQDNKNRDTHTFIIYEKDGMFYHFENSYYNYRGIHKFNTLEELLKANHKEMNIDNPDNGVTVIEYKAPKAGIGFDEFNNLIFDNGKNIKLNENLNESSLLIERPVYEIDKKGQTSEVKKIDGTTMNKKDYEKAKEEGHIIKVKGKIQAFTPERGEKNGIKGLGKPSGRVTSNNGKSNRTFYSAKKLPSLKESEFSNDLIAIYGKAFKKKDLKMKNSRLQKLMEEYIEKESFLNVERVLNSKKGLIIQNINKLLRVPNRVFEIDSLDYETSNDSIEIGTLENKKFIIILPEIKVLLKNFENSKENYKKLDSIIMKWFKECWNQSDKKNEKFSLRWHDFNELKEELKMKNPSLQKLIEDVYKIKGINQGGKLETIYYDRPTKEAAISAAKDGLDVSEENLKAVEKVDPSEATGRIYGLHQSDYAKHNKKFDNELDNTPPESEKLHENGDMLAYFADKYGAWFSGLKKRYKNKKIKKEDAIKEIESKTSASVSDRKVLLKWMGFHKASEALAEEYAMKNPKLKKLIEDYINEAKRIDYPSGKSEVSTTGGISKTLPTSEADKEIYNDAGELIDTTDSDKREYNKNRK